MFALSNRSSFTPGALNGNTGIVPPYIPAGGDAHAGILAAPLVRAVLDARVAAFVRIANALPVRAPFNADRFCSVDVTPAGEMGVNLRAYAINGHFMLCERAIVPGGQPAWYDLGAIPPLA